MENNSLVNANIETFVCSDCDAEFEASCQIEFDEKKKKHRCKPISRRVVRTYELQQQQNEQYIDDLVTDRIQEHNFNQLIKQGAIV